MGLFGLGRKKYDLDLDKEIGGLNRAEETPETSGSNYGSDMSGMNYGNQPTNATGASENPYEQNPENTGYNPSSASPYRGQNEENESMQRMGERHLPHPQSKSEAAQIMISKLEVINSKIDLILNRIEKLEKKNEEQEEPARKRYW